MDGLEGLWSSASKEVLVCGAIQEARSPRRGEGSVRIADDAVTEDSDEAGLSPERSGLGL